MGRCVHLLVSHWPVTLQMGRCVRLSVSHWPVTLQMGKCVRLSVSHWPVTLQMGQSVHISIAVVCHPSGGARCVHFCHSGLSPFRWGKVCTFLSQWSATLQVGQGVYISISVVCQPSGGARCVHFYHSGLSAFRWGKVCTFLSQWSVSLQVGQGVYISVTGVCQPSAGARCAHLCHSGQSNKSCLICEEVKSLFMAKTLFCCHFMFESAVLSSSCLLKLMKRPWPYRWGHSGECDGRPEVTTSQRWHVRRPHTAGRNHWAGGGWVSDGSSSALEMCVWCRTLPASSTNGPPHGTQLALPPKFEILGKADLLEWMRFVMFCARSRERSQCTSGPISE